MADDIERAPGTAPGEAERVRVVGAFDDPHEMEAARTALAERFPQFTVITDSAKDVRLAVRIEEEDPHDAAEHPLDATLAVTSVPAEDQDDIAEFLRAQGAERVRIVLPH